MKIRMTPGEYKNGGVNLSVNYVFANILFGAVIVSSTEKGILIFGFSP